MPQNFEAYPHGYQEKNTCFNFKGEIFFPIFQRIILGVHFLKMFQQVNHRSAWLANFGGGVWSLFYTRWWLQIFFILTPYLGKISTLTNIFQMGWNHQLVHLCDPPFLSLRQRSASTAIYLGAAAASRYGALRSATDAFGSAWETAACWGDGGKRIQPQRLGDPTNEPCKKGGPWSLVCLGVICWGWNPTPIIVGILNKAL